MQESNCASVHACIVTYCRLLLIMSMVISLICTAVELNQWQVTILLHYLHDFNLFIMDDLLWLAWMKHKQKLYVFGSVQLEKNPAF